ncbi:MAG TPA: YggT family protein [Candidatus Saccharibacteria bacterium]|nr:YggT family protein [Candidatus Saccharibacteria bacterium]HRK93796.1 YggT family protein [Candidatus Saccharibacteria bacterium]
MVARFLAGLINFFIGLAEVFLGLRVLLRLFNANSNIGFVQWVYDSSDVLLDPFRGIFTAREIAPGNVVDFSALFAMLVYGLVGMLFLMLVVRLTPDTVVETKK